MGCTHGDLDRLAEQRTHRDPAAGLGIQEAQLAVRTEAAVGPVDLFEEVDHGRPSGIDVAVLDEEVDAGPQGAPAGVGEDGYEPPLET